MPTKSCSSRFDVIEVTAGIAAAYIAIIAEADERWVSRGKILRHSTKAGVFD